MTRRRVASGIQRLGRRLHALLFPPTVEAEVDEELDHHVRMHVRELVARGWGEDDARRHALERLGDVERVRATCRRLGRERESRRRISAWWSEAARDAAYGLRQLCRRPGFAAVAVLTLALGIGANTAMFSVVEGVLLRPLPYEEPEELLSLWTRYLPSTGLDIAQFTLSGPEFIDYRDASRVMDDVVAYTRASRTLTEGGNEPERVPTAALGRGMLDLLGVRPVLGRTFAPEEQAPGAARTVILSHGLWTARFGGDPAVLGSSIRVDGEAALVAGVMGPDFVFPHVGVRMWETLRLDEADPGGRGGHYLYAVARLRDGSTPAAARAELGTITARWYAAYEHHAAGHFIWLEPLRAHVLDEAPGVVLLLMAAVGLVLLIACGNVANLFLARAEARQREMAVRAALGAGRRRLGRQLLVEALVVAALGGVLGLLLAAWATPVLLAVDPTAVPRAENVRLDPFVLAFTFALVGLATLVFGLLPILQGGPVGVPGVAGGRSAGPVGGRRAFRRALVAGQAALSLVVVVAAGLAVRSFEALRGEDAGVVTEGVVTFELSLPASSYPGAEGAVGSAYGELLTRVEALPGVASASAVSLLPLSGDVHRADFLPEGAAPPGPGVPAWNALYAAVRPGYFETLRIPLLEGRAFTADDDAASTPVAMVGEALVARYFAGQDVLGRRITFGFRGDHPIWITVVGVVADVRNEMREAPPAQLYLPHDQLPAIGFGTGRTMTVVVRSAAEPGALVPALRAAVGAFDARLPLADLSTMEDVKARAVARPRLVATLLTCFGVVALLLAAVGIYGVVSWSVEQRTREIGVRVALGAVRGRVLRLMVREGAAPAVVGTAVGLAAALAGARALRGLLYGVSATDPLTFILLPLVLVAVAAIAAWIPARRATRVAPTEALRAE